MTCRTLKARVTDPPAEGAPRASKKGKPNEKASGKSQLLKQLQMQNNTFNLDQRKNYRNLLDNKSKGVQIKKAF